MQLPYRELVNLVNFLDTLVLKMASLIISASAAVLFQLLREP